MSGVAIIRKLLVNDSNVLLAVPATRIMAGALPINSSLPVISIRQISGIEFKTVKRSEINTATDRVQVTALASTYVQQKEIIELIRNAIVTSRSTINGFDVDSIDHDLDGPDLYTDNPVIYEQSIDYIVRFYR